MQSFYGFYITGCVYSLHYSVGCLPQSFYCLYTASVSIPYTGVLIAYIKVSIAYHCISVAFTSRVCLQLTIECRVLALVFLLLLHSECVYSLHQSVQCLLWSFCCICIASVSIAYLTVFIAYSNHYIAFTSRVCLQLILECCFLQYNIILDSML